MFKAIISEVVFKLGRYLTDLAFKQVKRWWRKYKYDSRVDKEVEGTKEAIKKAKDAVKKGDDIEKRGARVPPAQEKELREATRELTDGLF